MGLDDPVWEQYWRYMNDFFTGDWGFSYSAGEPVRQQIGDPAPGHARARLLRVRARVRARRAARAARRRTGGGPSWTARCAALSFFGLGTPPFWFGLIALLLLLPGVGTSSPGPTDGSAPSTPRPRRSRSFYTFDALLAGQWATAGDAFAHLVLPVVTLALAPLAFLVRLLRANLLEVSREHFLVVVRSKGLGRWPAFTRHALPNAFLPTLTASGLLLAQLLTGSVLVEKVFNWPGVGALVVDSILRQDFAVVQAFILLSACFYVAINLVVDVLYGVIDPRVRVPVGGE